MPAKGPDARVEISSDLAYVRFVVSAAETFADIYGFNEDVVHDIGLAVSELATNAIKHGNRKKPEKRVATEFYKDCNGIEIYVTDEDGEQFDFSGYFEADMDTTRRGNGRGIFIVHRIADELTYEWPTGRGTRVRFAKHKPDPLLPTSSL